MALGMALEIDLEMDKINHLDCLPVVETFHSVQGEGAWMGTNAFFIRLAGCDVGCPWCDTKISWNMKKHPAIAIADLPLLQQNILQAIGFGDPVGFDAIVEQAKAPAGEVSGALLQLELIGAIAPYPGMRYQRLA